MVIDIPFHECVPVFRGRFLKDVETILPEEIQQFGFPISNKQAGKFQLEIDWIKAYKNSKRISQLRKSDQAIIEILHNISKEIKQ